MKEERLLETMFEQARKEKPKRSYESVAKAFSAVVVAPVSGLESLVAKPIILNGFVGLSVMTSVVSTQVVTTQHNQDISERKQNTILIADEKDERVFRDSCA